MDDSGVPTLAPSVASTLLLSWRRAVLCGTGASLLLAAVVILASCLTSETRPLFRPAPAEFAVLAQDIATFRALPLKRSITLAAGFADPPTRSDTDGPFELKQVEQAYKNIALLPSDADLAKALGEFRQLDQLFAYDGVNGTVALGPAAAKLGVPFEMTEPTLARQAPLGFAIATALQEQNFHWQEKTDSIFLEDHRLALRALATGDAVVTLIARAVDRIDLTVGDLVRAGRFASELEKAAARLPDFLRDKISFPYREGSRFVFWALKAKGWPGVDALYADPPLTTAAVLHPEKYFVRREQPLRFFPAALLRQTKDNLVVEQSLGEQLIRGLLANEIEPKLASDTAAAWRGDQLFAFQNGGQVSTVWYSAWTSPNQASAFQRVYKNVLERRQRIRFGAPAEPSRHSSHALSGRTRDNRAVWLQTQGPVVLLLSGVPIDRLGEAVDEAWRDLEIESDPTAIRFDSVRPGKNRRQLSLNKRSHFAGGVNLEQKVAPTFVLDLAVAHQLF